jgi:sulfonate transport system permease protein
MTITWNKTARYKALALPVLIIALWWLASARTWVNPLLLPSPREVARTSWLLVRTHEYWEGLGISLVRTLLGFFIATALGGVIGIALGGSRWANRIAGPTFHAFRQIAPFAWIPLISAWFGGGDITKVAFITVAALPAVIFNTIEGVQSLHPDHRELARTFEISRWRYLSQVVTPSALPAIFTGLQLALVVAWLATVGAEYFLQIGPGVTFYLSEGRSLARMDMVLFGIATIGLFGFLLTWLLTLVERRVLRWRPSQASAAGV